MRLPLMRKVDKCADPVSRDALRNIDGGSLVVTIEQKKLVYCYIRRRWQHIEDKLQKMPSFNAAARRIQRLLLIGHATDVDIDANGRCIDTLLY